MAERCSCSLLTGENRLRICCMKFIVIGGAPVEPGSHAFLYFCSTLGNTCGSVIAITGGVCNWTKTLVVQNRKTHHKGNQGTCRKHKGTGFIGLVCEANTACQQVFHS